MRFESLLCALVILAELSGGASAGTAAAERPTFSSADAAVIARNELLQAIVVKDPWLVRRMLDALERMRNGSEGRGAIAWIDPQRDPDLASATRTAEGSVEWFELLKRARDEKAGRRQPQASSRSAEGSVELIEMMKRVKSAKDKAK